MSDLALERTDQDHSTQQVEEEFLDMFNEAVVRLFKSALRNSLKAPSQTIFLLKTLRRQKKAMSIRMVWEEKGLHVPTFMIFSVTGRCNLRCKGCYAHAQHRNKENELDKEKVREILLEARELGISIILIAGGEPLMRPELIDVMKEFPEIIFPVFTNGMLIDDAFIKKLRKIPNVIPILSIEGLETQTDARRGKGIYAKLIEKMKILNKNKIFFGTSLTVTSENYNLITSDDFVAQLVNNGCKLFFYVDYVPIKEGTEHLILSMEQATNISKIMIELRERHTSLFVAFPGDEEKMGGCLSSGRGFIHISPEGRIEPCPFAPYSDSNIKDVTLKQALQSEFLLEIRKNHNLLIETKGGCALWENREWVSSLREKLRDN